MQRLLLISYGFPPVSRVQSQGAAKLARGLAELGWDVHVLTVADPPTFLLDESLTADMPEGVTVHRTFSLEPTRVLQAMRWLRGRRPEGQPAETRRAKRSYTSLSPAAVRFLRACFFPDEKIGWAPWAVREAVRLHDGLGFDAIVSTGPPYTDHVIGRDVARRTGAPWLAVLMDPIVGCYAFPPATPLHDALQRRLERQVATRAKAVAVATRPWADALIARNPDCRKRAFVFPNSFEPGDFHAPAPAAHQGFLVSYVGTFQLAVRPDDLLAAAAILREDPAVGADLRLRFVAPLDPQTDDSIRRVGLEDAVERTGLLGHVEAVREMRGADVLVLILAAGAESSGILSGKLPEYLAAGSAVLAIVPEGVAAETVRRAGAGEVVAPGDVDGIVAALRRLHAAWKDGRLASPDPVVVAEFDRIRNVARLEAVLQAMVRSEGLPEETS